MTATADLLLQDALRLPVRERSRIASRLIESVDDEEDFELGSAWEEEIARRLTSAKNGFTRRIPHQEVMEEMQGMLATMK